MTDLFTDIDPAIDQTKDYLVELVGEGKKFKTEQDLARGKAEADLFIARLTTEMEGLRTELNTRLTLEQYVEKMTNSADPGKSQTPNPDTNQNGNGNGQGLTPEQIEDIVLKKVSERETERIQTQNVQVVQEALRGHFGTDYVLKLRETTQALGLDESFMSGLARTQPKAFLKLVGIGPSGGTQTSVQKPLDGLFAPPVTHQTSTLNPGNTTRNWAHYQALKAKDPKTYWSAQTQNQLHQDALKFGEDFYT